MLTTAASRQAKHHPVYPGTRTVRGAIRDRLGEPWGLYKYGSLREYMKRKRSLCSSAYF